MVRGLMKMVLLACLLCLFCVPQSSYGQKIDTEDQVEEEQMEEEEEPVGGHEDFPLGRPVDFKAFKERYKEVAVSPKGAVRMYFDALYTYIETDPLKKAEGVKMLRYSLHEGRNWESSPAWGTFVSRLKDRNYHYIFRSFAEDTSPLGRYKMDPDDYKLVFVDARPEADFFRIQIESSGADSPRPVHVKQFEDGLWYVINNHGTYTDVRHPVARASKKKARHDADND